MTDGTVRVQVRGAVSNDEYRLMFCHFGPAPRNCDGIGNFMTDDFGAGEAVFVLDGVDVTAGRYAIKRPAVGKELTPIQFVALAEEEQIFNPLRMETVNLTMNPDDWNALSQCERGWFETAVDYRGVHVERVGVEGHNRRNCDPRFRSHPNLILDFARNLSDQRFFGLKRLQLRSWCCDDDTLLVEDLEIHMFRQFGLPAARLAHVRLFVNDAYVGVYNLLDRTNTDMSGVIPRFFENDRGNLYLLKNTHSRLPSADAFLADEKAPESPQSYIPDPFRPVVLNDDGLDIVALVVTLNYALPEEIRDRVGSLLDLNNLIDYLAVDMSIADTDGLIAYDPFFEPPDVVYYQNNTFLYHDPTTDVFHIFPEDLDDGLIAFDPDSVARGLLDGWDRMTITRWILNDTKLMNQYFQRVENFVDWVYVPSLLTEIIDQRVALMTEAVREDLQRPDPPLTYDRWLQRTEALKQYIYDREANIRQQLPNR